MKKYTWPNGDNITVNCPNCGLSVDVQVSVVKEYDLPLRPAECEKCRCDFDVFHDGKIELLRTPPKVCDPEVKKKFLEKYQNIEFDPDMDDDDGDLFALQKCFEESCSSMPGFNSDKNRYGEYKDTGTQSAWEGYQDAEKWEKHGRHQKVTLPGCPEPVEGWCDCVKCKAMRLHKGKNIYVCLICHKQAEPLSPLGFNLTNWLPDKE